MPCLVAAVVMKIAAVSEIKTDNSVMKGYPFLETILKRLEMVPLNGYPKVISTFHRRSIAVKTKECGDKFFILKGIGWSHGPPWTFLSPKDDQLYFGLMDENSAVRELSVSNWFYEAGIHSTRVLKYEILTEAELAMLDLNQKTTFKNGSEVSPVVLVTQSLSAFRVNDFTPRNHEGWLNDFYHYNKPSVFSTQDIRSFIRTFAEKLVSNIERYQALGGVNDTLSSDNVTLAAEITDFEWVYVPGIPLPDGCTDQCLFERQEKEALYYIDIMLALCEGLSVDITIKELASIGCESLKSDTIGFSKCLMRIAEK